MRAPLRGTRFGLAPDGEGWFVVNAAATRWLGVNLNRLRPGHCPGGTAHAILGAGDGPSLVLAFGARGGRKRLEYLVDVAALRHRAGVETPTGKVGEAYARFPHPTRVRCGEDWLPRRCPT